MAEASSPTGKIIIPAEHDDDVNLGKWDRWYQLLRLTRREASYGDLTTYYMAASFLADCAAVEDWGCGAGGFSPFCRGEYIGVDGSETPFASRIADLTRYRSEVDGLLLRHVLEHNYNWPRIIEGAVASFRKKLCIVLFTPFSDTTRELAHNRRRGVDAPDLSLATEEIEAHFPGLTWVLFRDLATRTQYGVEHVYCVWRKAA
jgi:hypothetical protein